MIEGSGAGYGSLSPTNGSGSEAGRPKNIGILQIRIRNTGKNMSNGGTASCRDESMVAELTAELGRHPLRQPEVTLEAVGEQEDECSTLRQVTVAN
jgi:hypothetical protein